MAVYTKEGKLIYHLTKLENVSKIMKKGLLSRSQLQAEDFSDIANPDILSKRRSMGLDDYIPFHFHPRSAFDKAVQWANPDDYFVYVCVHRNTAASKNFKILPQHPTSRGEVTLYDYEEGIEQIDWDALDLSYGEKNYDKQKNMAECLCPKSLIMTHFQSFGVPNESVKNRVEQLYKESHSTDRLPFVNIQKTWFE